MLKCDSCEHKEVCSKKEAYKQAYDNLNKDVGEFEAELKCKWFKTNNYFQLVQQLQQSTSDSITGMYGPNKTLCKDNFCKE